MVDALVEEDLDRRDGGVAEARGQRRAELGELDVVEPVLEPALVFFRFVSRCSRETERGREGREREWAKRRRGMNEARGKKQVENEGKRSGPPLSPSLLLFSVAFFSLLFPRTPFEKLFKSLSEKSGNYSPDR